jgi:hypothetical protein
MWCRRDGVANARFGAVEKRVRGGFAGREQEQQRDDCSKR